ncbi:hypothetical protein ONE63_003112 [Megalurothrips usitatus]|uniref:Uncharacterized protein n=1 Tax=Megalurothrips usitatus TaxID=439358 RepID=A0AAV7XA97_9NEOP|nr:hypothetical protein ONE63_003112 [Megalurothrips usitatus]
MPRGSVAVLLALAAALAVCTSTTVALAPAAPPVLAFSASLDYGGQPANYDYARIATLKGFPVDRREGAPAPLQQQHQQHPGRA